MAAQARSVHAACVATKAASEFLHLGQCSLCQKGVDPKKLIELTEPHTASPAVIIICAYA